MRLDLVSVVGVQTSIESIEGYSTSKALVH